MDEHQAIAGLKRKNIEEEAGFKKQRCCGVQEKGYEGGPGQETGGLKRKKIEEEAGVKKQRCCGVQEKGYEGGPGQGTGPTVSLDTGNAAGYRGSTQRTCTVERPRTSEDGDEGPEECNQRNDRKRNRDQMGSDNMKKVKK